MKMDAKGFEAGLQNLKHRRSTVHLKPLQKAGSSILEQSLDTSTPPTALDIISIKLSGFYSSIYNAHLMQPEHSSASLQQLFEIKLSDTRHIIKRLLVGLSDNSEISLMVFPNAGVAHQLCHAISGSSTLGFDGMHYRFTPEAGADSRSRVSLLVQCHDRQQLKTLNYMLIRLSMIINNSQVTRLFQNIYKQAHRFISKEKPTTLSWAITEKFKPGSISEKFIGFPNKVPDSPPHWIVGYPHDFIKSNPDRIPAIHQAVLEKSVSKVQAILSSDKHAIYYRDAIGLLPIQVSCDLSAFNIVKILFEHWQSLPEAEQFAMPLFIEVINNATSKERSKVSGTKVDNYKHKNFRVRPRSVLHHAALRDSVPSTEIFNGFLQEKKNIEEFIRQLENITAHYTKHLSNLLDSIPVELRDYLLVIDGYSNKFYIYFEMLITTLVANTKDIEVLQKKISAEVKDGVLKPYVTRLIDFKRLYLASLNEITFDLELNFPATSKNKLDILALILAYYTQADSMASFNNKLYWTAESKKAQVLKNLVPATDILKYTNLILCPYNDYFQIKLIFKSGLLSYEQQDAWGYTPLLLAISADNFKFASAFISRGLLAELTIVNNGCGFYTPLEHCRSARMIELLLKHFYTVKQPSSNVDSPTTIGLLTRSLAYGCQSHIDYRMQTIVDKIISGRYRAPNAAAVLKVLLSYSEQPLPSGPYDRPLDAAVLSTIDDHNNRLYRKSIFINLRAKLNNIELVRHKGEVLIASTFKQKTDRTKQAKIFFSVIKSATALSSSEINEMADIFAERFKMPNPKSDSLAARKKFFKDLIKRNPDYKIDLTYDSKNKLASLFLFKIIDCENKKYGKFKIFYASLLAASSSLKATGMPQSSLKILLATYLLCCEQKIPLEYVSRYGQPGAAMLTMPKNIIFSPKYERDPELIQLIANASGNKLEKDGRTSFPPVLSTVKLPRDISPMLEQYHYLLFGEKEKKHDASMIVTFAVDQKVYSQYLKKLNKSNGITTKHLKSIMAGLRMLMADAHSGPYYQPKL